MAPFLLICLNIICRAVVCVKGTVSVTDPVQGVCGDPVNGGAILGKGGPDPQGGNKERQLDPDKGRDETRQNEKTAGSQGRRPLHGFKMPACTE
jgi:hypothetical protein